MEFDPNVVGVGWWLYIGAAGCLILALGTWHLIAALLGLGAAFGLAAIIWAMYTYG